MPQALAVVAPTLFGVGGAAALVTTAGTLTILGIGVSIGGGLLLSAAFAPSASGLSSPKPEDVVQNFQSTVAARQVHMGSVKVGGAMLMPPRSKGGKLYILLAQMHGEMSDRVSHYIDGGEVTLSGNSGLTIPATPDGGYVNTAKYVTSRPLVKINFSMGTDDDLADPDLVAAFPDWTSEHRARGIATTTLVVETPSAERFNRMFPNRVPTYSCVTSGAVVIDPRTNTSGPSDNPIVHLYNYMISPDGLNLSTDALNDTFLQAMNDCDDVLATGKRYRIGGSYLLTQPHSDVIRSILSICDGDIYRDVQGRFAVRVGKAIDPTVTLDTDHLVEVLNWVNGNSLLEGYTSLNSKYTDENLNYASSTIDPYDDDDLIARYGRKIVGPDPDFTYCPDHTQARILSKIKIKKDNPLFRGTLRYDLHGAKALGERFVNISLTFDEFGVDYTGPAMVVDARLAGGSIDNPNALSYVDLDIIVIDPDTYTRTVEDQGTAPSLPASEIQENFPVVQNLAAIGNGTQTAENSFTAGIAVSWDQPAETFLSSVIEYSRTMDLWQVIEVPPLTSSAQIPGLNSNFTYNVRHAFKSPTGSVGPYETIVGVDASATSAPPNPVQSLAATDQTGGVAEVSFQASDSVAIWKTNVFRDGVLIYSDVTNPDQVVSFSDSPGVGSYVYTATTLDVAARESTVLGTTPATTIVT